MYRKIYEAYSHSLSLVYGLGVMNEWMEMLLYITVIINVHTSTTGVCVLCTVFHINI